MKKLLLPLFLALSFQPLFAASTAQLIREGQREMQQGNWEAARARFQEVLLSEPKNPTARNLLKIVEAKIRENPRTTQIAALRQLVIPSVNFDQATLGSALEVLRKKATEASNGSLTPNFVLDPAVDRNIPVTLTLKDVPLEGVLKYLSRLTNLAVKYEPYAILLLPLSKAGTEAQAAFPGE